MQISLRRVGTAAIFDITGDIDLANSPEIRKAFLREIRDLRTPRVLINFSGVRYMDSSGVASLVEGLKASRELGCQFILFALTGPAREVMRMTRLLDLFEIHDSEESALAS